MKPKESKFAMTGLRDASIIVAAGVTIVGTVLWLKQGEDTRQLAATAGDEQQKMRVALERLAATLERVETQIQALVAAQHSDAAAPTTRKTPAVKRAVTSDGATPAPTVNVRRRQSSTPKTSRSRATNGTSAALAEGAE